MSLPEQWRPIPGYEGIYEASDQGQVRSLDRVVLRNGRQLRLRGQILLPSVRTDNRLARCSVKLSRDGEVRTRSVHVLVMQAFVGPCPPGMETCHRNGDGTDNRLVNLRYDTHGENVRDTVRHGNHNYASRTHCPRRHPLAGPNLVPSSLRLGRRECLACNRAQGNVRYAKRTGRPHDFAAWANDHYARIMAAAA